MMVVSASSLLTLKLIRESNVSVSSRRLMPRNTGAVSAGSAESVAGFVVYRNGLSAEVISILVIVFNPSLATWLSNSMSGSKTLSMKKLKFSVSLPVLRNTSRLVVFTDTVSDSLRRSSKVLPSMKVNASSMPTLSSKVLKL